MNRVSALVLLVVLLAFCTSVTVVAETIVLRSGNAPVGQRDPLVTVRGSAVTVGGEQHPAAMGVPEQQALVVNRFYMWVDAPVGSKWLSCAENTFGPPGGYIYQLSFTLPRNFATPRLSLQATSDNGGEVVFNGRLLTGNPHTGTGHLWMEEYLYSNPTGFHAGENALEFHVINGSDSPPPTNPTGIAFSATIDYTTLPEPSGLLALASGLGSLGLRWRRRGQ